MVTAQVYFMKRIIPLVFSEKFNFDIVKNLIIESIQKIK